MSTSVSIRGEMSTSCGQEFGGSAAIYLKTSGLQDMNHCRYPCEACAVIVGLEIVSSSRDFDKRMPITPSSE